MKKDIIGKRFGRLVVRKYKGNEGRQRYRVICDCDCGEEKEIYLYSILSGDTKSCGCLNAEVAMERRTTHGLSNTREYNIWSGMKCRCYNINDKFYSYYGGKGITVCDRWQKFENFFQDMGNIPIGMSLDRIDSKGNYCPENCKWSTAAEQSRNRDFSRKYTYKGETKCLSEFSRQYCIKYKTLIRRMNDGWTIERALTTKVDRSKSHHIRKSVFANVNGRRTMVWL